MSVTDIPLKLNNINILKRVRTLCQILHKLQKPGIKMNLNELHFYIEKFGIRIVNPHEIIYSF